MTTFCARLISFADWYCGETLVIRVLFIWRVIVSFVKERKNSIIYYGETPEVHRS